MVRCAVRDPSAPLQTASPCATCWESGSSSCALSLATKIADANGSPATHREDDALCTCPEPDPLQACYETGAGLRQFMHPRITGDPALYCANGDLVGDDAAPLRKILAEYGVRPRDVCSVDPTVAAAVGDAACRQRLCAETLFAKKTSTS